MLCLSFLLPEFLKFVREIHISAHVLCANFSYFNSLIWFFFYFSSEISFFFSGSASSSRRWYLASFSLILARITYSFFLYCFNLLHLLLFGICIWHSVSVGWRCFLSCINLQVCGLFARWLKVSQLFILLFTLRASFPSVGGSLILQQARECKKFFSLECWVSNLFQCF